MHEYSFTTGPPNGPVLFCSLASVVCLLRFSSSATLLAGGPAGRRARGRSGGRHCTSAQYGYVPLGRHLVTYIATVCKLRPITCNKKLSYRRGTARRSMLVDIVFLKTTVKASLPSNHLFHFYSTVIRPVLEYCVCVLVWHYALTKAQTEQPEAVQKIAIRIILNFSRGMPCMFMLSTANLAPLLRYSEILVEIRRF